MSNTETKDDESTQKELEHKTILNSERAQALNQEIISKAKIKWADEKQRIKEWKAAKHHFASQASQESKQTQGPLVIKYRRQSGDSKRAHSFAKIDNEIYALAGKKQYVDWAMNRRVKLATDEHGNLVTVTMQDILSEKHFALIQHQASKAEVGCLSATTFPCKYYRVRKDLPINLLTYTQQSDLSMKEKLILARQCVELVMQLHNGKLSPNGTAYIHGDLRLEKFLINSQGNVTLAGLYGAHAIPDSNDTVSCKTVYVDSQNLMAPELQNQVNSKKTKRYTLTKKIDIYSMGYVLGEILPVWNPRYTALFHAMVMSDKDKRKIPLTAVLTKLKHEIKKETTMETIEAILSSHDLKVKQSYSPDLLPPRFLSTLMKAKIKSELVHNTVLRKALKAGLDYLQNTNFGLLSLHGSSGKLQTLVYINKLFQCDGNEDRIKQEMQNWLSGVYTIQFGPRSRATRSRRDSRAAYAHESGILVTDNEEHNPHLFFQHTSNKSDRQQALQKMLNTRASASNLAK
ncbi:MAG: hypothetical protein P1U34_00405 [Coxiellaceae bacterium]|nr:hypothetical protein [Coxiellaceae bacterium]